MTTNKLTDKQIQNLKPGPKKTKHFDGGGLALVVLTTGTKTFQHKYRFEGKERTETFGPWPIITLAEARRLLIESKRLLARGIDPIAQAKANKLARKTTEEATGNTVEAIGREWFDKFSPGWAATHSNKIIKRLERDLFPYLGKTQISNIKPADLLTVLRRVEARGTLDTAHRLHQNCGQVWRYAIATGRADRDITQDLRGALPPAKGSHFAAITNPVEFGKLLDSIDNYHGSPIVKHALQLAPLVFVRPTELRLATWSEFDIKGAIWTIPAARMKAGRPHVVPLSRQSLAILKELKSISGGDLLFPSTTSRSRPISDAAMRVALQRMDWNVTVHGFRASASTMLENQLGYDVRLIEIQLAHQDRDQVRASYKRETHLLKLTERKEMMQAWADFLDTLKRNT
jgi:integrase